MRERNKKVRAEGWGDEELVEAAKSGKLTTREDYQREVERILKKRETIYLIDPILADKNYQDNSTDTAPPD